MFYKFVAGLEASALLAMKSAKVDMQAVFQLDAGAVKHPADEVTLTPGVVRAATRLAQQLGLQLAVLRHKRLVGAKRITERQPLAPEITARDGQMQMVGVGVADDLIEQHGVNPVHRPHVPQPLQDRLSQVGISQDSYPSDHVDDRF
jgi:hypothetical protein